jgi:nicotinate-nucleotide adenylyltransferase
MNRRDDTIGIFGGTFNPIHYGHLRLAEDVREEFSLDSVIFIPSRTPPHKEIRPGIDPARRLAMVERAIRGNPSFRCDDVEIRRGGVSYTVDTVEYVYGAYAFAGKPFFIVGSDLLADLDTWKDIERLLDRGKFIALLRGGVSADEALSLARPLERFLGKGETIEDHFLFFSGRKIDITSSEIREKVAGGKSIRYLVPDGVLSYIEEHGLYRKGQRA